MRKEAAVIEGWLILSSYGIEIQLNHKSPLIFYLFNCYIGDILPFFLLWTEAFLDPDHWLHQKEVHDPTEEDGWDYSHGLWVLRMVVDFHKVVGYEERKEDQAVEFVVEQPVDCVIIPVFVGENGIHSKEYDQQDQH